MFCPGGTCEEAQLPTGHSLAPRRNVSFQTGKERLRRFDFRTLRLIYWAQKSEKGLLSLASRSTKRHSKTRRFAPKLRCMRVVLFCVAYAAEDLQNSYEIHLKFVSFLSFSFNFPFRNRLVLVEGRSLDGAPRRRAMALGQAVGNAAAAQGGANSLENHWKMSEIQWKFNEKKRFWRWNQLKSIEMNELRLLHKGLSSPPRLFEGCAAVAAPCSLRSQLRSGGNQQVGGAAGRGHD